MRWWRRMLLQEIPTTECVLVCVCVCVCVCMCVCVCVYVQFFAVASWRHLKSPQRSHTRASAAGGRRPRFGQGSTGIATLPAAF